MAKDESLPQNPSETPTGSPHEHFDIHASVVFQLGESLISDPVQALLELVKNSYDADASYCKVAISTVVVSDADSPFKGALGSITIEDDGVGMSLDAIRRGWLTISNSEKREFKDKTLITKRGRTPLGDKGLGRLGTQRLGENLEMFTRPEGPAIQHHVWFSWKDFNGRKRLAEVDIHRAEKPTTLKHGTTLVISGLREPSYWQGDAVKELETRLSEIISPYREVRNFTIDASVDGQPVNPIDISEKFRQSSQIRYNLSFDGDKYSIVGKARLSYIRPDKGTDRVTFRDMVDFDQGRQFIDFLFKQKRASEFALQQPADKGWFVQYQKSQFLSEMDKLDLIDGNPANPGPFTGEIDFFSQGTDAADEAKNIFGTAKEYRDHISKLSGIKVYRDGFGIRVDKDWLNLGKQWTKAKSYYTLKPDNTLGYIAISARHNRQLEETTDREGFKKNAYYNNFFFLLTKFVEFSEEAQAFLRRGWLDFRKEKHRVAAQLPEDTRPEAISSKISQTLSRAASHKEALSQAMLRLQTSIQKSKHAIDTTINKISANGELALVRQATSDLSAALIGAQDTYTTVEQYLAEITSMEARSKVLTDQIHTLRDQIQQVHEIIGLGLTAEALSHEFNNITTQLAQRNQQLVRYLRTHSMKDSKILTFTEYVNSSISGLRRQLTFLAPSLQYVRENREVIDLDAFLSELYKHYMMHFADVPISLISKADKRQNFKIEMNKGKLIQIFDNLILNSEYWLKEDIRRKRIAQGTITIEAQKPFVKVSDNGQGVEPSLETSLFEPFVTGKGKGKGRGLGLYIVQQLLQAEGCNIRLVPVRNGHGRLFVFEIDLTGALHDNR